MYKVRFHLGRGEHFMHWQVKSDEGVVSYVDPQDNQLAMLGCKLSLQPTAATEDSRRCEQDCVCMDRVRGCPSARGQPTQAK